MSKATKRKHVTKEVLEDYYVPEDGELIVKVIGGRGNNLHEVETAQGIKYLVSMPTKFRRNVWVKRGDFVIISPIEEGNKVKGEIVYILYAKQIKYLKSENLWPVDFDTVTPKSPDVKESSSLSMEGDNNNEHKLAKDATKEIDESCDESSEEEDDGLFTNPNHRPVYYYDEDSSSEEEESDDEGEEHPPEGEENQVKGDNTDLDVSKLNLNS